VTTFSAATFRMPGNAAATQTLFAMFNAGTARVVRVRRLVLQADTTGVLAAPMPLIQLARIGGYTGGQALTKAAWTATASHADVQVRGRNTSDGGGQTNIVATPGDVLWQQAATRLASAVGQVLGEDQNVAPLAISETPIVLRQGQGLLVQVVAAAGTSNPTSIHWFVQSVWTEEAP
jgi:hypothetical protein